MTRILSWDLSPLRPWEYWQMDAREWTDAVAVRQAFDAGVAEYQAAKTREGQAAEQERKLIERAGR